MTRKIIVNPGERFGRLTIVREVETIDRKRYFMCKCDCGVERKVRLEDLRSGRTAGCGCIRIENLKNRNFKHGMRYTNLYKVWLGMKERCSNPNHIHYKNYGGRGITVCEEWLDFQNFYDWSQQAGYEKGLSIDRIDVNGNYEPSNCTWIPLKDQARNKQNTIYIEYKGETKSLIEWAEILKINHAVLQNRYTLGWSAERMLEQPVRRSSR